MCVFYALKFVDSPFHLSAVDPVCFFSAEITTITQSTKTIFKQSSTGQLHGAQSTGFLYNVGAAILL